jgi:hypothetical protein
MKTILILLAIAGSSFSSNAQSTEVLDTIYANDHKNVALFFTSPIRQGITGSENFVFTYNRKKEQHFGLLQATPGKESNLLIISTDGSIFSYIVRYKERLSTVNYFVPDSSSIGNEKPFSSKSGNKNEIKDPQRGKKYYYKRFSDYLLDRKQKIGRIKERTEDIVLSVENIVFDKEELYFVINIENESSLDYDLNFLNLYIETRKKGKRKSLQRLYQEPIFKYNVPARITENETVTMVYVLPKFSLGDDKKLVLELNENQGERNMKLNIKKRYINNPN